MGMKREDDRIVFSYNYYSCGHHETILSLHLRISFKACFQFTKFEVLKEKINVVYLKI